MTNQNQGALFFGISIMDGIWIAHFSQVFEMVEERVNDPANTQKLQSLESDDYYKLLEKIHDAGWIDLIKSNNK